MQLASAATTTTLATAAATNTQLSAPAGPECGSGPVFRDAKAVPSVTVHRVETDAGAAAYEAHMTKADGTAVTVKFDKSLAVVRVETGMGQGDRHHGGLGSGPAGVPSRV